MDIKEYIAIFQKEKKLFWIMVVLVWFTAALWQAAQPAKYQATLLLNVGRTAASTTEEYTYDNFYRLQADERFADTLVRWLQNPRVVSDIMNVAGVSADHYTEKQLTKVFTAKRLSSQVVEVRFGAENQDILQHYADGIKEVTASYTSTLSGGETNWFRVVASDPVIRDARVAVWPFFGIALLGALFVAFWAVLAKHFFTEVSSGQKNNLLL
jgi:capsular polysaccharide biosynthesis protein